MTCWISWLQKRKKEIIPHDVCCVVVWWPFSLAFLLKAVFSCSQIGTPGWTIGSVASSHKTWIKRPELYGVAWTENCDSTFYDQQLCCCSAFLRNREQATAALNWRHVRSSRSTMAVSSSTYELQLILLSWQYPTAIMAFPQLTCSLILAAMRSFLFYYAIPHLTQWILLSTSVSLWWWFLYLRATVP
jgi:hypothetical protein